MPQVDARHEELHRSSQTLALLLDLPREVACFDVDPMRVRIAVIISLATDLTSEDLAADDVRPVIGSRNVPLELGRTPRHVAEPFEILRVKARDPTANSAQRLVDNRSMPLPKSPSCARIGRDYGLRGAKA